MKKFNIEILTPERSFYKGGISELILNTTDGEIGIMANHIPMVVALKSGSIKISENGRWREAAGSDGFAEITPDGVIVLAQTVEWPDEIEENRVNAILAKASEQARQAKSLKEYKLAKAGMARAFARLRVKNRRNV